MSGRASWTEVRAVVPLEWAERTAEVLGALAGNAALIGTPTIGAQPAPKGREVVRVYLPAAADDAGKRAELRRSLVELGRAVGSAELATADLGFRVLPPEDWARSWKKVWRPFRVGRLEVVAPWTDVRVRDDAVRLVIEPGAVFGSGRHATTRTVLRVLARHVRGGESVLDCGTGSGILAVAAALLGASRAEGFDLDPASRPAATELAATNGVGAACSFETGGFDGRARATFDVVCANIYADVLQARAAWLADRLAPGGFVVASGCALPHRDDTRSAFADAGLTIDDEHVRGRWVTLVARR